MFFNPSHTLHDDLVISAVWSAMKRHTNPQGRLFICRQQKAVGAEIVKADRSIIERTEKPTEAASVEKLARQKVMALKTGIITG